MTASIPPMPSRQAAGSTVAYLGASEDELLTARTSRRVLAMADQRLLFPHRGALELSADTIDLAGWRTLTPAQVTSVELKFTATYPRWLAAGIRGRNPSLGWFASLGKPLVVGVDNEAPLYLLLGFTWWSGTNQNRKWFARLVAWLGSAGPGDH